LLGRSLASFAAVSHGGGLPAAVLAAMAAGVLAGCVFGFITLTLQANQVAAGLSLTILGAGVSAFLGRDTSASARHRASDELPIPLLSKIPLLGPALLSMSVLAMRRWYCSARLPGFFTALAPDLHCARSRVSRGAHALD